ncbi:DUF3592 domain-containing protein [Spongisporangium articulatum]|uniref:DUF3592 domain-containing protein n=1 Tax=Spongisporangium articulatum TaxID=3362603 RepID=A0ABW8ANW0_9ACTN
MSFDHRTARDWAHGLLPWWVPSGVLIVAWGSVLTLSISTDAVVCTATDPCGQDDVFGAAISLVFLTPVLLWSMPRLGCLAGVALGLYGFGFDSAPPARIPWAGFALACLVTLLLLHQDVVRRRGLAERAAGGRTARVPQLPGGHRYGWRTAAAGGLMLAGLACLTVLHVVDAAEQRHVARAVVITATVTRNPAPDDSYGIELSVPGQTRHTVEPFDTAQYPVGTSVPVLVDPADPGWFRLVAERADNSLWLTGAVLALLAAGLLFWRDRSLVTWVGGWQERPALMVLVDTDGTTAYLHAVDAGPGDPPFAEFGVEYRQLSPAPILVDAGLAPGTLVGDVTTGGAVAVLLDDAVLLPRTALRTVRDAPWWWVSNWPGLLDRRYGAEDGTGRHRRPAGSPDPGGSGPQRRTQDGPQVGWVVPAAEQVPTALPIVVRPDQPWWSPLLLPGVPVVSTVAAAFARWAGADPITLAVIGFQLAFGVYYGWTVRVSRLVLDADGLQVDGPVFSDRVPWTQISQLRVDDDEIMVFRDSGRPLSSGPYADVEAVAASAEALRAAAGPVDDDPFRSVGRVPVDEAIRVLRPEALLAVLVLALGVLGGIGAWSVVGSLT